MLELKPKGGARIARSAGNFVQVVAKDAGSIDSKMPSSEIRKVKENCLLVLAKFQTKKNGLKIMAKPDEADGKAFVRMRGTAMNSG